MIDNNNELDSFERKAKQALEFDEQGLSPEILERLGSARRAAVAQVDEDREHRSGFWAPAGAFAVTALAVGAIWFNSNTQPPVLDESFEVVQLAQLAMHDSELLEDLEFIAWMAEQEEGYAG